MRVVEPTFSPFSQNKFSLASWSLHSPWPLSSNLPFLKQSTGWKICQYSQTMIGWQFYASVMNSICLRLCAVLSQFHGGCREMNLLWSLQQISVKSDGGDERHGMSFVCPFIKIWENSIRTWHWHFFLQIYHFHIENFDRYVSDYQFYWTFDFNFMCWVIQMLPLLTPPCPF